MRYILITGAREYPDIATAKFIVMDRFCRDGTTLVHGNARGIDKEVADVFNAHVMLNPILRQNGCVALPFNPEWTKYGKAAGPIRNGEMVKFVKDKQEDGEEVICLAFPLIPRHYRSGTWDCIGQIERAGLSLEIYPIRPVSAHTILD